MAAFGIGLCLPLMQEGPDRVTRRWPELRAMALRAEALGFDTVWVPDELLWAGPAGSPPRGAWDGVSMLGAVAAITSTIAVGSWVLSALHRNAGIIAKTAETLDEIAGGRFIFGLGAGHEWPGQARAFGLPESEIFARFDESLAVILPLLRDGQVTATGRFHSATELVQAPRGPRGGAMPLWIGLNGPKGQRHAARHADVYSCYVEERALPEELAPRVASFEAICAEEGRDPVAIGRSVGVSVDPTRPAGERPSVISGTPAQIAEQLLAFQAAGITRAELMYGPGTLETVEILGEVLTLVRAG